MLEPLEQRQLLDGAGLLGIESLVAGSPPVDWSILSMAQAAPAIESAAAASAFPLDQTFLLHSNPGASKVIYLDFDGHTTTGTLWNSEITDGVTIVTPAYSFEGDSSFSDNELARIQYIWQRVAEDYIPFNVDVTTQDPGSAALIKSNYSDTQYGVRVSIGGDSSWYGSAIGGVAYVGSFDWNSDTPCFVFPSNLGNSEKYVAEAISHEVGHTLDLLHDGTTAGVEYYQGQGSGATGWAPIMGVGYYKELTQWDKGEYYRANNQQDDLAIITASSPGGFGYRVDDHGGTIASAAGMTVVGATSVSGDGIIERTADLDFFSFTTGQGLVSLSIAPAPRGPNLDILATLYDSFGAVVAASNPIGALNASFSLSLLAGTYYLSIDGTGEGDPLVTGYSDYGSLGYYSISGTIVALGPVVTIVASDASAAERGLDPGMFTISRTGNTDAAMEVFYSVSESAGNGVDYQQIPASITIPAGAASMQITITPIDDSLREGEETVVLALQPGAGYDVGAPGSATVRIADDEFILSTNNFAVSEATTYGSIVSSSLLDTQASDNVYEQLKEEASSNLPYGYSRLQHQWTFNVAAGGRVTFFVEAYHTANTEGDDFTFSYSTDGASWTTLLTVTKTADNNVAQQAALPDGLSGTVYIRVVDTDHTRKKKVLDSLYIDKMFIRSDPSFAGDVNVDGIVDASDYIALKMAFGITGNAAWNDGDFDQDGDVDYADLSVLISNFGRTFTPAPAAAPIESEPAPVAAETVAVAAGLLETAESIPLPCTTIAPVLAAPAIESAEVVSAFPLDQTFLLHSNPGASKVIYLDFDGHTTTGTTWNVYTGGAPIVTPAFNSEGDSSSFSDNELARLQYIWQRVAEDFIPYDVDVTTQDPGLEAIIGRTDGRYGQRVVIGGDSRWYQGSVVGGVAYVSSFGSTPDKPCFVFSDNLGTINHGNEKYVAEAISHEVGHTLGLRYHDGAPGITYYEGQGDGPTGWAPLMGIGYYRELTQWSQGEYTGATNHRDELSIIAGASPGGFGYRVDDHGGTIATADSLTVVGATSVSGEGIIERTDDLDFFSFTTGEGLVTLSIDPAPRGPNLDILATLYDSSGVVVTVSNPIGALNASFSLSLLAGTYYLSIDGTGEGDPLVTGYSDYGSLGYYSITGTIVPEAATMSLLALGGLTLLKRKRKPFF